MKVNPGKCHILLSTKNSTDVHLEGACITSSLCEKLLGITEDSDLKFDQHIPDLCNKGSKNINTLCRIRSYPLIQMFDSRILNNKFIVKYCLF